MTIHFVYPFDAERIAAPWSIGNHVAAGLRTRGYQVEQYDWEDTRTITPALGDVLLGHYHPEAGKVFRNSLASVGWRRRVAMSPWNGSPESLADLGALMPHVDRYLAICGPHWAARLPAGWPATAVDMAIDPYDYPRRTEFRRLGRRTIGYFGCCLPCKGVSYLGELSRRLNTRVYHFGAGSVGGHVVECGYHDFRLGVPVTDFAISCGVNDANPTSMLEAACWGMVNFATPTSGWGTDLALHIPRDDVDAVARIINEWLVLPAQRLESRRAEVDSILSRYSWEAFLSKVLEVVS